MKRSTKVRLGVWSMALALPAAWFVSEFRWSIVNNPNGKFTSAAEYLARGRLPRLVQKIEKEGQTFFLAYSPMDSWLAVPSGPAAYVFGPDGTLVDWSRDTGDDSAFRKRWPRSGRLDATVEEMERARVQPRAQPGELERQGHRRLL